MRETSQVIFPSCENRPSRPHWIAPVPARRLKFFLGKHVLYLARARNGMYANFQPCRWPKNAFPPSRLPDPFSLSECRHNSEGALWLVLHQRGYVTSKAERTVVHQSCPTSFGRPKCIRRQIEKNALLLSAFRIRHTYSLIDYIKISA